MKRSKKALALFLALVMCIGVLAGCGGGNNTANNGTTNNTTTNDDTTEETNTTPLVVSVEQGLEGKFSPYFYLSNADNKIVTLTQVQLLTIDRVGNPVLNGIEGETRSYNGTDYTYYGPADIVITENDDGYLLGELRREEHLHAGFQGRAASDNYVIAGAGREPEYLRERHMGHPQALFGWQDYVALQALSRLSQRRKQPAGDRAGGSGDRQAHLSRLS